VFTAYLFYGWSSGIVDYPFDAGTYWKAVTSPSLEAYDTAFRGYSFPYLCFLLRTLARLLHVEGHVVFRVVSALTMALLGTIVVPRLTTAVVPLARLGLGRVLAWNAIVFLMFRGYANYPLTDIPALLALLSALLLMLRLSPGRSLLAGMLVALAVNLRPVYAAALLPAVAVLGTQAYRVVRRRGPLIMALCCTLFFAGATAVFAPQIYVNHHTYHRWALLPATDQTFGKSLYLVQLELGMKVQKYETSAGTDYPHPSVYFGDPTGRAIAAQNHAKSLPSFAVLVDLWRRYPREFLAIYVRHLLNGLDVQYPQPYLDKVFDRSPWLALFNYAIVFSFVSWVARNVAWRSFRRSGLVLATVLAPCLVAVPTMMEIRFLLPLHLLMYTTLCFGTARSTRAGAQWSLGRILLLLLFVGACYAFSDSTYAWIDRPGRF
jgi:hypothetical protein